MTDAEKVKLLAWILKKWGIPEDATEIEILGAMHVAHHQAHGYRTYIVSHRCEDKQGEIARQTVRADKAEVAAGAVVCGLQEIAAGLHSDPGLRAREILEMVGAPIEGKGGEGGGEGEHLDIFRKANGAMGATSRFGTASVTKACVINMKLQRGVRFNLLIEDLKDRVAEDGHESVVREIGLLTLGLVDAIQAEEKKVVEGFEISEGKTLRDAAAVEVLQKEKKDGATPTG